MRDENKNSTSPESQAADAKDVRLELLYEVGRVLASAGTMNEAAPQSLEIICRSLNFQIGEFWCLNEFEKVLRREGVWHQSAPQIQQFVAASRELEFSFGIGLPGKTWERNAPVWMENLSVEKGFPRREIAARPIHAPGREEVHADQWQRQQERRGAPHRDPPGHPARA